LVVRRCILLMGVAGVLGPIMSRSMLIVMAVRRSHFEDVGVRERLWDTAVFKSKGVLGSSSLSKADGEDSIVVLLRRGVEAKMAKDVAAVESTRRQ
jgi:hypothetical protein